MVQALCHRCGREWDYTGRSDHYGTCPNCNTSVKLHRGSERAEPSDSPEVSPETEPTAERCPDPSDRTAEVRAGGEEAREMLVVEAVESLDESVTELYELQSGEAESVGELVQEVEEREESLADLRRGLGELAFYFSELIEEAGGVVEYQNIDAEPPNDPVMEALSEVDMEEVAA